MKYLIFFLLTFVAFEINAQSNPYDIREGIAAYIENLNIQPISVFKVVNKEISSGDFSIPIRVYYPTNQNSLPILFHIHGGAWIAGNLDTHDNISRRLAVETNSIVIAIDYRRPPEHQYPVALNDCFFVLKWINENRASIKGDGRLFLIGDSAGGGLVSSLCIKNIVSETPVKIDGQVLINPATDLRRGSESYELYQMVIDWYVPIDADKSSPLISPLVFNDFSRLPKSMIVVSENDDIKNDGILFHQKMLESGNSSVILELEGLGHLGPLWASNSKSANPAVNFVTEEYRKWVKD